MDKAKVKSIAFQLESIGKRIIDISESELEEADDMLYDTLGHAQRMVLSLSKEVLGAGEHPQNNDGVFFEGELTEPLNGQKEV